MQDSKDQETDNKNEWQKPPSAVVRCSAAEGSACDLSMIPG